MGNITTNVTMNMCGTLMPEGRAHHVVAASSVSPADRRGRRNTSSFKHIIRPSGRKDAPEYEGVRHFQLRNAAAP